MISMSCWLSNAKVAKGLACIAAILAGLGGGAGAALGDVIDIDPDGNLTVYRAPSVFRSDNGHEIVAAQQPLPKSGFGHAAISRRAPPSIAGMISFAAGRYGMNVNFLQGVAWQESRFHHEAVSPKGAVGVMQLMAGTARDLGIDRFDVSQNILGGAAYLRQMLDRYGGNPTLALAAYNAGPGAVDHYHTVPPFRETQNYVRAILAGTSEPIYSTPQFVTFIHP